MTERDTEMFPIDTQIEDAHQRDIASRSSKQVSEDDLPGADQFEEQSNEEKLGERELQSRTTELELYPEKRIQSALQHYEEHAQLKSSFEEKEGQPDRQSHSSEENQEDEECSSDPEIQPKHKKYGKMVVFFATRFFSLSIGPNCIFTLIFGPDLFFILAYSCFLFATIYLVNLVNSASDNLIFRIVNFCIAWGHNLSYALVALSDPGVIHSVMDWHLLSAREKFRRRLCKKCGAEHKNVKKAYHCHQCNVCVREYDHHCPWTSKCIGGGNINRFYFFVCMTPFYIFYYMVAFMICMASLSTGHHKRHGGNLQHQTESPTHTF